MRLLSKLLFFIAFLSIVLPVIGDDALVVFSGRSDKFVKPVVEQFSRETGIKVILHAASSTALINKLKIEGERTQADLFISNDAGNLQLGSNLGLFSQIEKAAVKDIDKRFVADDLTWVGLSARARVLVANAGSDAASQVSSVFDLAKPEFQGKIGITNSVNESYIAGVTVYLLSAGKDKTREWLEGVKSNVQGKVYDKHSKIVAAVASGKKDVGLVNHYYIFRHLDKHPDAPLKIILPDQGKDDIGIAWNVAGVAMSKYSRNKTNALKLIRYLSSKKGQQHFAKLNREYPVRVDVATAAEIPSRSNMKISNVPMFQLGNKRNETIDLIEAVGMP